MYDLAHCVVSTFLPGMDPAANILHRGSLYQQLVFSAFGLRELAREVGTAAPSV
jgi:hypothetical protein